MTFIAMLVILSCQVPGARSENQALWAYVPDPPVLRPVTWNDPSFPVYLNNTSVLGFPSSSHITPQVAKHDFTAQAANPPMCFYASRIWDNYESKIYSHLPHPSSVHTVSNLDGENYLLMKEIMILDPVRTQMLTETGDWSIMGSKYLTIFPFRIFLKSEEKDADPALACMKCLGDEVLLSLLHPLVMFIPHFGSYLQLLYQALFVPDLGVLLTLLSKLYMFKLVLLLLMPSSMGTSKLQKIMDITQSLVLLVLLQLS
ncbi:LOW QUALITY PROTEIN: envelope glycoprotein [Plecturocebus cupreus]